MENGDLLRLASMLIRRHGEGAEMYACLRAEEALNLGNRRSCIAWKSIAAFVRDLANPSATTVH